MKTACVSLRRVIIAMNPSDNNTSHESFAVKRVKPRYINLNEDIFLKLSVETLKVYLALRYESDYGTDCSSVKKNIKFLMNKTGLPRRQIFYSLKEMENTGLLKRQADPGFQSIYWVAQDLGHFLPKSTEIDQEPVQDTHGVVQDTHGVVQDTHTITNNSFTNSSHKEPFVDFQSTSYKDDELFMRFYSIYPNKQKPEIARKAFYKLKPDEEFVSMLCTDIYKRVENNWKNRHKNKIPHPSTYLNGKEWEGEIYPPESNVSEFPVKAKRYTMTELMDGAL